MKTKSPYANDTINAVPYSESYNGDGKQPPSGPQIGALRIAKVTYDHFPIHASKDGGGSIGDMIDEHIAKCVHEGNMVSEVSLFFETQEQQRQVSEIYSTERN